MSSSPTLDIYLNQVGDQFSNEQLKQSEPFSSSQARPPHMPLRCSSIENVPKIVSLATPDAKGDSDLSLAYALSCLYAMMGT